MFIKYLIEQSRKRKEYRIRYNFVHYLSDRLYMNDNNIVAWYKGSLITSKCHENEKFNSTKGVLVCIAKIAGYTYKDIRNKLAERECQESDKAELFYLYEIAKKEFYLTENDIKILVTSINLI